MNTQMRPGTIALLAGGVVLAIGTFLPWLDFSGITRSGLSGEGGGWFGIFCLLMGLAVAILVAMTQFGNLALPDRVVGFDWNQLYTIFGFASVLMTLGFLLTLDNTGIGVILSLLGGAAVLAGGIMESQQSAGAGSSPTSF